MKPALAILVAAGGVLAAAGLAHVPAVRSALGVASCPFAHPASVAELEDLRLKAASNLRGAGTAGRAAARPAFGFQLDATTKDDVRAWGSAHGATCTDDLGGAALRCEHANVADGPGADDAFFRFDPGGRLVGVDVMRAPISAAEAQPLFDAVCARLGREAGPASSMRRLDAKALAEPFARAGAEFRFADYAADVSAMNDEAGHVVVREQYRTLAR
jgi:hypothetical protein